MSAKLFFAPALAAVLLLCTACDKRPDQAAQNGTSTSTTMKYSSDEMAKGTKAIDVANPQTTLASSNVENEQGESLGQMKSVTVGSDGKAQAVNIEVANAAGTGSKIVAIDAAKFTYLADHKVLVASFAKSDVEAMPAVPVQ